MALWKAILTYDGTPFNGWQIQPNVPTVQGTLAQAIHHITGESVLPQGSGRTDAGVHALAQVASFELAAPIPPTNLHKALNRALPPSIRILSIEQAPADFHARHSALRKTYEYRISTAPICSPMLAPYVWSCPWSLDLPTLQQAAAYILGTHDFTSFAAVDPDLATRNSRNEEGIVHPMGSDTPPLLSASPPSPEAVISTGGGAFTAAAEKLPTIPDPFEKTPTRTIFHSSWHCENDLFIYRVTGSGFLHHMVRNLVGTFVEAARGRIPSSAIPYIIVARDRNAAGPTAPARGLFLVQVEYYPHTQHPTPDT